jgi:hypothetical protein
MLIPDEAALIPIVRIPNPPEGTYWLDPGRILAGPYPGAPDAAAARAKLQALLDLGVHTFVNLMEEAETDHSGRAFRPYDVEVAELAHPGGASVSCLRFPIQDRHVPTLAEMERILETLDQARSAGPVYLHCWGGVGRTGTVAACWLLRHRRTTPDLVLEDLAELRRVDRVRGDRPAPENATQQSFVRAWAARAAG